MQGDGLRVESQQDHGTSRSVCLNGRWTAYRMRLTEVGEEGYRHFVELTEEPLIVEVPGEIHLDLMRVGQMEDPDVSDNAQSSCRWPEQYSWWYRRSFEVSADFLQQGRQEIVFEGIDLYGQIFLNGKLIGKTKNAFAAARFDIRRWMRAGKNELVVRVTSGMELPRPPNFPSLSWSASVSNAIYASRSYVSEGRRFLRKPAYSAYGWDFCDALPNVGICGGVRLEARSCIVIDYVRLDTIIVGGKVSLDGEIWLENLHPWREESVLLEVCVEPPTGAALIKRITVGVPGGRFVVPCRIEISDPQLWWPNGMGEQPLYVLTLKALCDDREVDRCVQRLGLRTVKLDRAPLDEGSRFCFKVNGQDVFCKGANWAPPDLVPSRMTAAHYRQLISDAKQAHFTMLRVNGVGLYEREEFYDACDQAGILVWQDFAFSCALYPQDDPEFRETVGNEARHAIRRLRHHPSLALWCGNNECAWTMAIKCGGECPEEYSSLHTYNDLLPNVCHRLDPIRPYWPGSPAGGSDPNDPLSGDYHWWGEGEDFFGPEDRRMSHDAADRCRARFVSEYGVIGPASKRSVECFLKPHERTPGSVGWKIHTNVFAGDRVEAGIRNHYGDPQRLSWEQYILYGQMFQAQLQGRAVDAMRFRKHDPVDDCQGVLVWSYNDTWGEIGWSIVDHYGRRKPSYYWYKRSAAPVKILVRSRGAELVTRVVNDTLNVYDATVRCGWMRVDGQSAELLNRTIIVPANGMVEVARTPLPSASELDPRHWLYAAILTGEGFSDDQAIWLLAPYVDIEAPCPMVSTRVDGDVLEVSSPVYCHGVHLEDDDREPLADNYFDLLPGIPRRIPLISPTEGWNHKLKAVAPIGRTDGAR